MAGILLFAVPFGSLITQRGPGVCSVLFLVAALVMLRQSGAQLARHWPALRWVVAAFALHAVLAGLLLLRSGTEGMNAEKPLRMLLALAALPLVLVCKPDRRWLWAGAAGGAVAGAALIAHQRFILDVVRPGGLVNAITAGDLLICLTLLSLTAALEMRGRARAWPALGALAGIGGALMTGTRGCLVALAAGAAIYVWHMRATRWARMLAAAFLVLGAALWFIPMTGVQARAQLGLSEIMQYRDRQLHNMKDSSMGQRLELWRAAGMLIAQRPLTGAGYATVRAELEVKVAQGMLHPEVLPREHFHNDALQALGFGGLLGLCSWLAILVAPLVFFARRLRGPGHACALAGVMLVASYLAFGLTEVIFWSMRANLFYALMVAILMGLCLNAKEQDGK
jgi:O-antigen ligase